MPLGISIRKYRELGRIWMSKAIVPISFFIARSCTVDYLGCLRVIDAVLVGGYPYDLA